MRRRITLTMVGVVAGALVVAMVGTVLLLRYQARMDTLDDLRRQARTIAARTEDIQRPQILTALSLVLRLEDLRLLCFGSGCRPAQAALPPGVERADLDLGRLRAGGTVSGTRGSMVYAAAGVPQANEVLFVVLLTRRVEARLPGGPWFVIVAGLTLVVAAAVAANLGRRLTRPLREAESATKRIAAGDLATRVPIDDRDGEELAGLSRSINTMAASLERSRRLERQFLLSVSHDLRTPLTSIRGFAEALADERAPDPAHAAGVILSESRRLERLVQDLLELARLDARRFSLDVRATDVGEVVADTAEGFRPAAEQAGVELAVTIGAANGSHAAAADPDRLAQVVANLVENALKYARSSISVGTSAGGDIWVEDDGPGIGEEDLPHVFEPFYRSARAASREVGTGLGLAIVHELVEAMAGDVRAESPPAGGTRVVVSLPRWNP
ncbi:MAG: sensor histidine kinase [Acidimicrobiales bacterium]